MTRLHLEAKNERAEQHWVSKDGFPDVWYRDRLGIAWQQDVAAGEAGVGQRGVVLADLGLLGYVVAEGFGGVDHWLFWLYRSDATSLTPGLNRYAAVGLDYARHVNIVVAVAA